MRKSSSNTFKNAVIDVDNMTITEETKDGSYIFNLSDVLAEWDKINGITLTIKKDSEVTD